MVHPLLRLPKMVQSFIYADRPEFPGIEIAIFVKEMISICKGQPVGARNRFVLCIIWHIKDYRL